MIRTGKKLQKIYLTCYNLLIVQDLWEAHQILSIIFLKEFIALNVNTDTMIKNVKLAELHIIIATKYVNFKDNLIEYICLCCNKNYQQRCDEKLKELFLNRYKYSDRDNNFIKFILLLQKGVCPYGCKDDWEITFT